MKILLNRTNILLIAIIVVFVYLGLNRLEKIRSSSTTTGLVTNIEIVKNRWNLGEISRYAIIEFVYKGDTILFRGEENVDYELGEEVKVIFDNDTPNEAKIYSFVGFWLAPLLYCIIPLWLIFALILSLLNKEDKLVITIGKKFSVTKEKPEALSDLQKLIDKKQLE